MAARAPHQLLAVDFEPRLDLLQVELPPARLRRPLHERAVGHAVGDALDQRRALVVPEARVDDLDGRKSRDGGRDVIVRVRAVARREVAVEAKGDFGLHAAQRHQRRANRATAWNYSRFQDRSAHGLAVQRRSDFPARDGLAQCVDGRILDGQRLVDVHGATGCRQSVEQDARASCLHQQICGFVNGLRCHEAVPLVRTNEESVLRTRA